MPLSAGSRLGTYEIVSRIGAGGMGEVYRARDLKLSRDVAIKVLPEATAADPVALSRFQNEARAVAALSHSNILAIHDFGSEAGVAFAVMELLEGETLRQRLDRGPIPLRRAAEIARGNRPGAGRRAPEGNHPPRPEAREPVPHQRRRGQDPRLRPRTSDATARSRGLDTHRPDRARRTAGNGRLHVPRTGPRGARRRTLGHLLLRNRAVRDVLRTARVPGGVPRSKR